MALTPAIFLDKDGTLLADVPYNVEPARMAWAPGVRKGVQALGRTGLPLVVVSNQPGVAMGLFDEAALAQVRHTLAGMFEQAGARLAAMYWCPHAPGPAGAPACACRKPAPGMLLRAAAELRLDLPRSWMVGDILDDVEAGHRAGCRAILVDTGGETQWRDGPLRRPEHHCRSFGQAAATLVQALQSRPQAMEAGA
ncbi:HAD family hydrolase [Orrella sp. JC864]|uniref:D-glycero-alpha-D-manno-heptose-1,7-bisphosphate 7-phosphatase n=1 Tax=Orrella sp. JC864 TaxID=3120298 RepID=UPI00300BDC12